MHAGSRVESRGSGGALAFHNLPVGFGFVVLALFAPGHGYRHSATHSPDKCVNRCPKRALRQTSNLKTPVRMRRGRRQNAGEDGSTAPVGEKMAASFNTLLDC